ncbi:Lrp/AsnC family transcriptional regulator [Bradyrhizobium sp. BEA-2-5]|uniref:Lrp/AsnC family transcriptional regulator n=1 Tax=Bradyrhizobium sp. BEA-2-5 TaxID=3080015 RepID=UPI00293E9BA3|nr:Lrp/AsnC family transcriptional regulator [Bradyrhizobium sp. BEA-2-5]WOH80318.1 Lrp/AsnC family transcriptional regulator [Bradyrhizobium sp. BEA-2-5]
MKGEEGAADRVPPRLAPSIEGSFAHKLCAAGYWVEDSLLKKLDSFDRKILMLIQEDATLTTPQIAERVGLSQAPCWRRIKQMEEAGIIDRRVTLLNAKNVGLPVMIFVHIKLQAHGKTTLPDFDDSIRRFPEVIECYTLTGETDYLLKVVLPSIEAYERFFREKLSQLPAVREANSAIALSQIKATTTLDLTLVEM